MALKGLSVHKATCTGTWALCSLCMKPCINPSGLRQIHPMGRRLREKHALSHHLGREQARPSDGLSSHCNGSQTYPIKWSRNHQSQNHFDVDTDTMVFPRAHCCLSHEGASSSGVTYCLTTHSIRSLLSAWDNAGFACRAATVCWQVSPTCAPSTVCCPCSGKSSNWGFPAR